MGEIVMTTAIGWRAASAILAPALFVLAIAAVLPSFAESQPAPLRYEYAALYQEVDGQSEHWRFASADEDTGRIDLDALAKALGLATAPQLHNTRIVNLLAQKGWELVTHARSQSPARWFTTVSGASTTTSSTLTVTEVWHFRRAK
jgi:hypothetical protein